MCNQYNSVVFGLSCASASQLGMNVDKGDGNCVKEHLQLDKVYNGNGGCQREREFNHNDSDGGRL